jgi:hypothetical protein
MADEIKELSMLPREQQEFVLENLSQLDYNHGIDFLVQIPVVLLVTLIILLFHQP